MPACGDINAVRALLGGHGIVICQQTIRNHIKRGVLPAPFHIGRRAFWDLESVAQAIVRLKDGKGGVA
jgi:hypothetical protein